MTLGLAVAALSVSQALALPVGTLVHVLHENWGTDQNDDEIIHPAGSIAKIVDTEAPNGGVGRGLVYPTGVYGSWETTDGDDPFPWALVENEGLRLEALAAFAAFSAIDEPTEPFPTPLLDAIVGPWVPSEPFDKLRTLVNRGVTFTVDVTTHSGETYLVRGVYPVTFDGLKLDDVNGVVTIPWRNIDSVDVEISDDPADD